MASTSPSATNSEPTAAVVLAGGAATRMGGADKGLLGFRGRPLVAHVLDRIAPQVDALIISANRNLDAYLAFGHGVVPDLPAAGERAGPLAGLQAAWRATTATRLLCVPCDAPHLPLDLRARLEAALGEAPLVVARSGGQWQPTVCLVRRDAMASLDAFLASGGHKVRAWQAGLGAAVCDFADDGSFANCNTPDELADWRGRRRHGGTVRVRRGVRMSEAPVKGPDADPEPPPTQCAAGGPEPSPGRRCGACTAREPPPDPVHEAGAGVAAETRWMVAGIPSVASSYLA